MSRSYKKWPSATYRVKGYKQFYNRALRRKSRCDYLDFPAGTKYKHSYCSWNIRDYIFHVTYDEYKEHCRERYASDQECYAAWLRTYRIK